MSGATGRAAGSRVRSLSRDRAAERFGLGGVDRAAVEKCLDRGLQIGRGNLRGAPPVVAQNSAGIQEEDLGSSPCVEEIRDATLGVLDDFESVPVLARVCPGLI